MTPSPLEGNADDLRSAVDRGRLLLVGQDLRERLGERLGECLDDLLGGGQFRPSEAHMLAVQLGRDGILTSNYDDLLEQAYAHVHSADTKVLAPAESKEVLHMRRTRTPFIFKLHGTVERPDTVVLGHRDYSQLVHTQSTYRFVMQVLLTTNTFLFVGFGANDPDLMTTIDNLSMILERSPHKHYLLASSAAFARFERRRLFRDYGIICLEYDDDPGHTQLVELLRRIADEANLYPTDAIAPPNIPKLPEQMSRANEMWLAAITGRELLRNRDFFERDWSGRRIRLLSANPSGRGLATWGHQFDRDVRLEASQVTEFFRLLDGRPRGIGLPPLEVEVRHLDLPEPVMAVADPMPEFIHSSVVVATQSFGRQSDRRQLSLVTRMGDLEEFRRLTKAYQMMWDNAVPVPSPAIDTSRWGAVASGDRGSDDTDQLRLTVERSQSSTKSVVLDTAWLRDMFHVLGSDGDVVTAQSSLERWSRLRERYFEKARQRSDLEEAALWPLVNGRTLASRDPAAGDIRRVSLRSLRDKLPFQPGVVSDLMLYSELVALIDSADFRYGHPLFIRDFGPVLAGEIPALQPDWRPGIDTPTTFRGRACEICHTSEVDVRHIIGISRVVRCRKCGLEYDNPQAIVPVSALDKYAASNEHRNSRAPTMVRSLANAKIVMELLRSYDPELVNQPLLDVGCASGETLYALNSQHQWPANALAGVEPSHLCSVIARDQYRLDIQESTIEDANLEEGAFASILVLNTMEHLPEPRKALTQLRRALRPGGLLILGNIPNVDGLMPRLDPYRFLDKNFTDGEHHYHYTPQTLTKLCQDSGFRDPKVAGRLQDIVGVLETETAAWLAYSCGLRLAECATEGDFLRGVHQRLLHGCSTAALPIDVPSPPFSTCRELVDFWRDQVWSNNELSETFWLCLS